MRSDLSPLEPPYDDAIQATFDKYYPGRGGELLGLFRVFARSPRLLAKLGAGGLLDKDSPLPLRYRELVILRVTANNGCEYEWGVHVKVFSGRAGLAAGQVEATATQSADARCWSETERSLLRAVDELCQFGRMGEATHQRFAELWTAEQQLEILALCGSYHTISFIANTAALAPEPWAAHFPSSNQGVAGGAIDG